MLLTYRDGEPMEYATLCEARPPHGREAIYKFAGWDPRIHLGRDGRPIPQWEPTNIVRLTLPEPLDYLDGQVVTKVAVHRKVVKDLDAAFREIQRANLWRFLEPYGGGYTFRRISGSSAMSLHSLGLALDFDPARNQRDVPSDQTRFGRSDDGLAVVRIFESHGWYWGGRFLRRPDSMHFQFGTGA